MNLAYTLEAMKIHRCPDFYGGEFQSQGTAVEIILSPAQVRFVCCDEFHCSQGMQLVLEGEEIPDLTRV